MVTQQPMSPKGMEMVKKALGAPLAPGELGVLMARAGVGKTACLTHIALEHMLNGSPVLHVCIDGTPDKVKAWYHELLKNIFPTEGSSSAQYRIEPLRFIQSYLQQTFTPDKLKESLNTLKANAGFTPSMIIVDGLDFDHIDRKTIEALKATAESNALSIWMSARTHRHISDTNSRGVPYPCHETDELFASIILLEPLGEMIRVRVLKNGPDYDPITPQLLLSSQTYLLTES